MKRIWFAAVLCLLPAQLAAQGLTLDAGEAAPSGEPQWSVLLRFTPYQPNISDDPDARGFFTGMFADDLGGALIDRKPMSYGLELDYYFYRGALGLIGVEGRFTYWKIKGIARDCGGAVCTAANATSAAGTTPVSLTIMPLSVGGVYRSDHLDKFYGIPLHAHAKVGVDYHMWWARSNGAVSRSLDDTQKGQGATWGAHVTVGLALNLDWINPSTNVTKSSGFQGTALVLEGSAIFGDGFGNSKKLDMSDMTLTLGIEMDFI